MSENKNIKNLSLNSGIWVYLLSVLFTLTFSSFNPLQHEEPSFDQKVKSLTTDWYTLFLKFESKDLNAYAPLSAEKLSWLGIAGYVTYIELHQSFDKKQEDCLVTLNEIYAHYIHQSFPNLNVNEINEIYNLKNQKRALVSPEVSYGMKQNDPALLKIMHVTDSIRKEKTTCHDPSETIKKSSLSPDWMFHSDHPVLPNWGTKQTFVADKSSSPIRAPYYGRPSFEKALYSDALEIYNLSLNLSNEDKWIAEFWSDDVRGLTFSPAGRWVSITNQILQKSNLTAPEILKLYLKLGVGIYDAGVICWYNKYYYSLQRPSNFINQHIDPSWTPLHADPDFPAYPSGHAVFGAVSATILEYHFGKDFAFTDNSHQDRVEFQSAARSFPSLQAMAIENAWSRVLIGVHYKEDCEAGLKLGYYVGKLVNDTDIEQLMGLRAKLPIL